MSVGTKIKRVRELKNMKQETLAEKLGMTAGGYGKIERDETDVPYSRLAQIAENLGMKTEELIAFDETKELHIVNYSTNTIETQNIYQGKVTDPERELYQKTIKLLEEKIALLEKL
ncbi:MAG: XRE family transcriptional regulator [Bacteroidetes bacterium]|nr:MAG: XRE family transcriptional regulator [Bacteroidota bacterium]